MNKGRFASRGCPRRGDRCGDRVKCALTTSFVLEKKFERTHKETPSSIEVAVPRELFRAILEGIGRLRLATVLSG
jgi:hypothetical protein